jgi:hypothetical protein
VEMCFPSHCRSVTTLRSCDDSKRKPFGLLASDDPLGIRSWLSGLFMLDVSSNTIGGWTLAKNFCAEQRARVALLPR